MTSDAARIPRNALRDIITSTLVWAAVGEGVATAVCFLVLGPLALFYVPRDTITTALFMGGLHSVWLNGEKRNWSSYADARSFALVTGCLVGLLGFAPAYVNVTEVVFHWRDIVIFLAAATLAGGTAGRVCVEFFVARRDSLGVRNGGQRALLGALIIVPVAFAEVYLYGPILRQKLPVFPLSQRDVVDLPAGTANGNAWSGAFQYSGTYSHGSGVQGSSGGMMWLSQDNGRLTVRNVAQNDLVGGIDSTGHFWAGNEEHGAGLLRTKLEGTFLDADRFAYFITSSLYDEGVIPYHVNSTLSRGTGSRWNGSQTK